MAGRDMESVNLLMLLLCSEILMMPFGTYSMLIKKHHKLPNPIVLLVRDFKHVTSVLHPRTKPDYVLYFMVQIRRC
jgi:hypothetical protein